MPRSLRSFRGVFIPSLTAILGAAVFLILPEVTAGAGLIPVLVAILLSHGIVMATGFSLADCATNLNKIDSGGLYTLSRLSFGNALGGTIGIQLFVAQAITAGFFCIGFALPLGSVLSPVLAQWGIPGFTGSSPDAVILQGKIITTALAALFFVLSMTGTDFSGRMQLVIATILGIGLIALFLTPVLGVTVNKAPLFTPAINLWGNTPLTPSLLFHVLALFFPAVTGITNGISRIGDLANHRRSLVVGVFSVIIATLVIYTGAAILFSFTHPLSWNLLTRTESAWGKIPAILILTGFLASTGYSALLLFRIAPDTLQCLATDRILPRFLRFLGRDINPAGTIPRCGMILTLLMVLVMIWTSDLLTAARLIGIQFLTVYAWLNLSAFLERFSRNPGFRPTFPNHWSISLFGFIASGISLFLINWRISLILIAIQFLLFALLLRYRSGGTLEGVAWGFFQTLSVRSLMGMKKITAVTRHWRPVVDAFSFTEGSSPDTITDLADRITAKSGLVRLTVFNNSRKPDSVPDLSHARIPAQVIKSTDPAQAIITLIQSCHLGGLESNTIFLDYNPRYDNLKILKSAVEGEKNTLLLVNGYKFRTCEQLDIWWRGEKNGNLMVLLAFILNRSLQETRTPPFRIRIIRRLDMHESADNARETLVQLLKEARITGEVVILPCDETPIYRTLEQVSHAASLIMMGLPGNFMDQNSGKIRLFNLDEFFFTRELRSFDRMPPILFVKSAQSVTVTED